MIFASLSSARLPRHFTASPRFAPGALSIAALAVLAINNRAFAQEPTTPAPLGANRPAASDATSAPSNSNPATAAPGPIAPGAATSSGQATVNLPSSTAAKAAPGVITAGAWHYIGGIIEAEGGDGQPVRFDGSTTHLTAQKIWWDTAKKTVRAEGNVLVEYAHSVRQGTYLESSNLPRHTRKPFATVTDTLSGNNFTYNFATGQGRLDQAQVRVSGFDVSSAEVIINGQHYIVRNVILRPGGLTEAERKIYGTPPFNLRAKELDIDTGAKNSGGTSTTHISTTGGKLYYNNQPLLPVPSFIFGRGRGLLQRNPSAFSITPRISANSSDGLLVTTELRYPFSHDPQNTALNADIGLSARVGYRGGLSLNHNTRIGNFALRGRKNDIVTTQLTNRIVLDRLPEAEFNTSWLPLFSLPHGQRAGLAFGVAAGDYRERTTGSDGRGTVHSPRTTGQINFTTRVEDLDGPYIDLFALQSRYSHFGTSYRNAGFEVGYQGTLSRRIHGLFSYRTTDISGQTPFRFDLVEIARELRTTFDIEATPRYLIPLDFRYDLDRHQMRDRTFGLLRSYKTFAYGVVYQTARHDLRLEVRSGF